MDILVAAAYPPYPLDSGARRRFYYIARGLWEDQHQLDLFLLSEDAAVEADIPRYEGFFRHVEVIAGGTRGGENPAMREALRQRTDDYQYEMAHFIGGRAIAPYRDAAPRAAAVIGPPDIESLRVTRLLERPALSRWETMQLKRKLGAVRAAEAKLYAAFDAVTVQTDAQRDALNESAPAYLVRAIPDGIDLDYYVTTGIEAGEPVMLFAGDFADPADVDAALLMVREIFPRVRRAARSAQLYIVGPNPPEELRRYASESVDVTGRVADLRPFYERALLYVCPTRCGAGMRQDVLAAFAMGTACLLTPNAAEGIAIRSSVHALIRPADPVKLAQAAIRLMRSSNLRMRFREQAYRLAADSYTWINAARSYESFYDTVLGRGEEVLDQATYGYDDYDNYDDLDFAGET